MIPQPGQHVKCLLRTSTIAEGIVESWTPECAVLKSLDGESLLILHRPNEDIVLTKVLLPPGKNEEEIPIKATIPRDLKPEFEQAVAEENSIDVRTKSLVELKQLQSQQERKILVGKLKEHHLGQTQEVNYEQPGFRTGKRSQ